MNYDCDKGDDGGDVDDGDDDDLLLWCFKSMPMAIPLNTFKYIPLSASLQVVELQNSGGSISYNDCKEINNINPGINPPMTLLGVLKLI